MSKRIELQKILEDCLGSRNVYFQPPESLKMQYPCIRYERNPALTRYANNHPYTISDGYELILIDKNPDSETYYKLLELPLCRHERHYIVDNLNHDVFYIYY